MQYQALFTSAILLFGCSSFASASETQVPDPRSASPSTEDIDPIQMAYEHRAYEPAFHMLSKLKQRTPAQDFMLGDLYAKGQGVVKQPHKGLKFYMRAAQAGEPRAQLALGQLFMRGDERMPKNYRESAKWYKMAADNNSAEAQLQLGLMHQHGRGVEKSKIKAYEYLAAAAEQGNEVATRFKAKAFEALTVQERKALQPVAKPQDTKKKNKTEQ